MLSLNAILLNQLSIAKQKQTNKPTKISWSLQYNVLDNGLIISEILKDMSVSLEFIQISGIFPSQWHSKAT